MARSVKLTGAIALAVLLAHLAALQWLDSHWLRPSLLKPLAKPMMTRLLTQEAPQAAPVQVTAPPAPKPPPPRRVVAKSVPAESTPTLAEPLPAVTTPAATASEDASPALAELLPQPPASASAPKPAPPVVPAPAVVADAPTPTAVASTAASATPTGTGTQAWLDGWPADTRLSYKLGGYFRGPLTGDAQVQWLRVADRYEVRIDIDIQFLASLTMTSQGKVTQGGLFPEIYEEIRGKRRTLKLGEREISLVNGKTAPREPGVQDTASQFVELTQMFATGRAELKTGNKLSFWMARPGAVDFWTYDILEKVILDTPELGRIEAFHLKPRPIANPRGNITAEMWFAPTLQYLPVRIRINMGEETHVDLLVSKIEQR